MRMEDCIFCKIVAGEIPCRKVYEDEKVLAFEDIHPMAPIHVVIIPKRHVATLMDVGPGEEPDLQAALAAAREVARIKGIDQRGFRVVINCHSEGGQTVFHLHMHLLGGLKLKDNLA
ncbi:MAG: histidine triad nucleotide-binding protein [Syntrophaceae bacterium]|nr:histidine triad nucleotide-binding protein [Syntrophaceae bacterium]